MLTLLFTCISWWPNTKIQIWIVQLVVYFSLRFAIWKGNRPGCPAASSLIKLQKQDLVTSYWSIRIWYLVTLWDFFKFCGQIKKRSQVSVSLHQLVTENQMWKTNIKFNFKYFRCCWFRWFAPKCFKRTIATT